MTFEREREQMIADIESGIAITRTMTGRDHLDPRVMKAMRRVPREDFVPADMRRYVQITGRCKGMIIRGANQQL